MKKVLIGVIIILLIVLACTTILKGISIGNFKILSTKEIADENNKLTNEIKEITKLMQVDYPTKNDELERNVDEMLKAKEEYLDLASVSTEGEIAKANQEETYTYEFLWTKLGRYATAEGVTAKFDFYAGTTGNSNMKNLNVAITGPYIAIINFMEDIEDDSKLGFRIENFKMVSAGEGQEQATFTVSNIRVKQEQTTASSTGTTTNQTENSTSNTASQTQNSTTKNTTSNNTTTNNVNDVIDNAVSNNTQNTAQ